MPLDPSSSAVPILGPPIDFLVLLRPCAQLLYFSQHAVPLLLCSVALLLPTRSAAQQTATLSILLLLPYIRRHNFGVRRIRWIQLRKSSFRSYDYARACGLISGVVHIRRNVYESTQRLERMILYNTV